MGARTAVTLKALAGELGLNPSTVSRVLNDPKGLASRWASPATTERIFALAEERGYRKNPYAASLRTAKSHMVGVVVPRLQDYVLATMYEGIDEAATEHGYFTVVSNSLDVLEAHRAKAEKLLDRRADGLIFGDATLEDPYLDELAARGVPFTLVSRRSPPHRSVTCDDYTGGRLVAEHLVAAGRRTFGLVAGDPRASTSRDRTAGFLDALAGHGLGVDPGQVVTGGFDAPAGSVAAERILARGPLPEAVFAVNDFAAIGALGVLVREGIRIPEDTAVVGFNDTPLAGSIGLTTVRSPMHRIGRTGFELLMELLEGRDVDSVQLAPELVVRTSG
ncbi:LacI family DNA-binding transcriptional regulator [Kocuria sp.]|jgi:LacI family transcriptional regulator|uniref:LacI family DNA-binding transcriptional regulator n=1 Tax=Kocuria sp. TaxID=1871328 RepID=UPI00281132A0|nr:LacI family DNA-binding transcriptional regulator [Kocuria sp.]HST71781.1 LacI family DNA-binding transcriptional regulator [Kocuria rosea]